MLRMVGLTWLAECGRFGVGVGKAVVKYFLTVSLSAVVVRMAMMSFLAEFFFLDDVIACGGLMPRMLTKFFIFRWTGAELVVMTCSSADRSTEGLLKMRTPMMEV